MIKRKYLNDKQNPANIIYPITDEQSVRDGNGVTLATKLSDLPQVKEGAALGRTAYQKPVTGIPASDIAEGVIPDVTNFVTRSVNDLVNYYTKSQTYTKEEVANLIAAIQQFHYEVVASTSAVTSPSNNVLYLVGPTGSGSDKYEEYVYDSTKDNPWIKIGDTSIDLSGYVTTQSLNTILSNYVTSSDLVSALSSKQDTLVSGTNIKTINGENILGSGNITAGDPNAVKYTAQTLTDAQKGQARENIDAIGYDVEGSGTPVELGLEKVQNKVTSLSNGSTDVQYPSAKAVFDLLGKWGVVSQTQTWSTPTGQPRTYTMSNLVYGIIPHSFIVQAENEGATFNETTGYFELNDLLDISYKEMLNIIDANALAHHFIVGGGAIFRSINMDRCPRTICIPNYTGSNANFADGFRVGTQTTTQISKIETISIGTQQDGRNFAATSLYQLCYGCQYLRKVGFFNGIRISSATTDVSLITTNCFSLEEFNLLGLVKNVGFPTSPALKVSSIAYMVDNSANTSAITITLHPTAYARCQSDTTEYTYNSQTYTGILAYASAKNITIASA